VNDKFVIDSARTHIAAILSDRAHLVRQIRQSEETITRSRELLKRIDEMLAKHGVKSS
jgi:hypothetical protein